MPASTALVNAGRAIVTNRLIGSGTTPSYIEVGTSSTAVTLADTTLGAAVESRTNGTTTRTTTSSANDTLTISGTVVATAPRVIAEAGIFDANSGGNMLVRGVLASTATLAVGDSITVTCTLQVQSSVI